ncbi:MAG: hypothetical protein RIC55_16335 [Pirellulaceae bacterium]
MSIQQRLLCASCLVMVVAAALSAWAQEEYRTADEAFNAGAKLLRARQEAESRQPLEAALRLAPDDAFRLKVYEALMPAYRRLDEIEPMVAAGEFVILHGETSAKRSLATRNLVGFLYQRGKLDDAVKRYEAALTNNADDPLALAALVTIYSRARRDADRAAQLQPRLAEVEKKIAAARAEKLEKDAQLAPRMATAYWKDAAAAWIEAGDNERALAAADKAVAAGIDDRSELLAHFWHRSLGDVYLAAGAPQQAVSHFESALALTQIEGYQKDCRDKIEQAKAKLADKP